MASLRPELRADVAAIPLDAEGVGHGVFDRVGTPRRWSHPLLALIGGPSIFAVWGERVPFEIRNRAVPGRAVVSARRSIRIGGRTLVMVDEIVATVPGVVVDRVGDPVRLEVAFRPSVVAGGLRLDSFAVRLRCGVLRLPLGRLSPRVVLTEAFDPDHGRQLVALMVTAPLVGRIDEYRGSFTYAVRRREGG